MCKPNSYYKTRMLNGSNTGLCSKCRSVFTADQLTLHHVIPTQHARRLRKLTSNGNILIREQEMSLLCRPCHDAVEKIYTRYNASGIASVALSTKPDEHSEFYRYVVRKRLDFSKVDMTFPATYKHTMLFYKQLYTYFLEDKIKP